MGVGSGFFVNITGMQFFKTLLCLKAQNVLQCQTVADRL